MKVKWLLLALLLVEHAQDFDLQFKISFASGWLIQLRD